MGSPKASLNVCMFVCVFYLGPFNIKGYNIHFSHDPVEFRMYVDQGTYLNALRLLLNQTLSPG